MTLYSKEHPLTVGTVTHETTHKILVKRGGVEPHGPEFSKLHAHVVRNVINPVAGVNLTSIYERNGVRK
jgi:predicted SprT family Zn-dependent metalloprotease